MAGRGERLLAWFVNFLLLVLTLVIGWIIWWFIVAPKGQNPGKAIVGLRVIGTDGRAVTTGGMFVRGLVGWAAGFVPFGSIIDSAWLLWDKDVQTIHDKVVNTVVVKANGSEKIVEQGHLAGARSCGSTSRRRRALATSLSTAMTAESTPAARKGRTTEAA